MLIWWYCSALILFLAGCGQSGRIPRVCIDTVAKMEAVLASDDGPTVIPLVYSHITCVGRSPGG